MSLLRHAAFAFVYGALAIAAALTLPISVPGVEKWTAVAIGAAILAFGALIHETAVRHERERQLTAELDRLTESRDAVLHELDATRDQMRAIHSRLTEQAASADAIGDMQAEVRLLHGLVRQLTGDATAPGVGRGIAPGSSAPGRPGEPPRRRPPPRVIDAAALADGDILGAWCAVRPVSGATTASTLVAHGPRPIVYAFAPARGPAPLCVLCFERRIGTEVR